MNRKHTLALRFCLLLLLTLGIMPHVQAQERRFRDEPRGIGGRALDDPPPAGFFVRYMFTGARNSTASPSPSATSVHCTNFGSATVTIQVEIFSFGGGSVTSGSAATAPGTTLTFSSRATAIYFDDVTLLPNIELNQGSGRVLVNANTAKIICTAQVVDPTNNPPLFAVNLDLFRQ